MNNKDYIVLRFSANWADEFDLNGYVVTTKGVWAEHVAYVKKMKFPREQYFGTNEMMEWEDAEDYLRKYHKVSEMTREEARNLLAKLGITQEDLDQPWVEIGDVMKLESYGDDDEDDE